MNRLSSEPAESCRIETSDSLPGRSTPRARRPTRRPVARATHRSIKRRRTFSTQPSTRPNSLHCGRTGTFYSRISNPTVAAFEERMASLESGLGAVAFASGLAAQLGTVLALAQSGDHIVCSANVYGGTITQLSVAVKHMGIETTFVDLDDRDAVRRAFSERTRLMLVETVANPSGALADIEALARIAHDAGVPLAVDNTFATPTNASAALIERGGRPGLAFGHQVHRRPRDDHRRRRRRVGHVSMGERTLSVAVRTEPRLPPKDFHGNVRRVRIPHAVAGRGAARHRFATIADGRVAVDASVWKRCRCGWNVTPPTRVRLPHFLQGRRRRLRGFASRSSVPSLRSV